MKAPAAPGSDAAFEEKRLDELVTYSVALRPQMVAAALVIAAVVWDGGQPAARVAAWLAFALGVRELRAAWLLRLRAAQATPLGPRLRLATVLSFALGAGYGSVALFMPALDTAHRALLTMLLLSLGAGAISTTYTLLPAFVAFGLALTLPAAAVWALDGGWLGLGVALLVAMFLGVQVRFARQTFGMFVQAYRMGRRNDELLAELGAEREKLRQARDAAVAADLAKSRFLASASHDLRQPLQSLMLNSGALARQPLDASTRGIAVDMAAGIEALGRMLEGLLDISRLDAGSVGAELRSLRLARLLAGMVQRFEGPARARGLRLELVCPEALAVISDAQMLQRVVSNLLDNAIKFTEAGSVRVEAADLGSRVRLSVIDSGSGIASADHARVFEDLVQLHNPQRARAAGHGLGLGIVRRLCRLLGIELHLESQPGQGTQVHLDLPPGDTHAAVLGDVTAPNPGLVARRLLVLDDDAEVRSAYAAALGSLGCVVRPAAHLDEALALLDAFAPEVALVDYRLGGVEDGIEACRRLRAARPGLLAVLVSADTGSELRHRAALEGLPTLCKPVSDTLLAVTINRLLAEPSARRQRPQPEGAMPGDEGGAGT